MKGAQLMSSFSIGNKELTESQMLEYFGTDSTTLVKAVYDHLKWLEDTEKKARERDSSCRYLSETAKDLRHFKENLKLGKYNV